MRKEGTESESGRTLTCQLSLLRVLTFMTFCAPLTDGRLTAALQAMETLSIVAYSQPITRKEIDNIRGVASDSIVRLLREREYIKVVGRKDVQGHPCLYGTSRKFLFEFGLKSISDLPKLSNIDRLRFDKSAQESEEGENTDGK